MKERILNGWTFTRVLYFILGIVVIVQSIIIHQWIGLVMGAYFAAMGLFAFGCAAGNCLGGNCAVLPKQSSQSRNEEIEELKMK